ncbi:MAG: putative O-glycosylation ligase, exosortase A system-associated [Erythrobacter sp.]|uniref:putative O-glycosylation ligase, exosortase A system-associated n=1 Tax=Erythrobacter sp. TaxID=1042 RepID=UPI003A867CE3
MLDLVFLSFIAFVLLLGLRRPFLWVLLYVYIDILAPQRIGYSLITSLPVSLIAFGAAFGGWLLLDRKEGARFSLRQFLLLIFMGWCWYTLQGSAFPEPAGTKWDWVWKALLFAIFLPLTITTRARIEALGLTVILSVATIVVSTGLKTVLGGGGYGSLKFFVNDNSGIYESSTLATIAIGLIPMIVWFMKHGTIFRPHWTVSVFGIALIFASLLIPIGTEARTGLLCIAALGVLLLRFTEKRLIFVAAAGAMVVIALPFLPQSYYDRMATIAEPGGDQSASTRVAVWEWTIDYANRNPLGGGFDSYRANSFTYVMPVKEETDNTVTIQYQEVTDEARAFHSSVFEVLGEQGYPGLIIWLSIHLLGVWQMEKIYRRWRGVTEETESWIAPMASALQMASLIYFVGALFQGIAYQPAFLMIVGLQIGLDTYVRRLDSAKAALDEEKRLSPSEKRRRERACAEAGEASGRGAVTA